MEWWLANWRWLSSRDPREDCDDRRLWGPLGMWPTWLVVMEGLGGPLTRKRKETEKRKNGERKRKNRERVICGRDGWGSTHVDSEEWGREKEIVREKWWDGWGWSRGREEWEKERKKVREGEGRKKGERGKREKGGAAVSWEEGERWMGDEIREGEGRRVPWWWWSLAATTSGDGEVATMREGERSRGMREKREWTAVLWNG